MRAIVFDLDGTLVDSAPDLAAAANAMLSELGRPALSLGEVRRFIGNGVPTLVSRCLAATGGAGDAGEEAGALAAFRRHYDAAPCRLTRPYPGVAEALAALSDRGHPLGICTNKPEGPARAILEALGFGPRFAVVVGGDSLPVLKPDPAPLAAALEGLGRGPDRALFVGDSETDAATAEAAGVAFALFTEGYRRSPVEAFACAFRFDRHAALPDRVAALG